MTTPLDLETVPCDLCGERETATLFVGTDRRFGAPGEYPVVQCTSCGLVRLNPRPTQDALNDLYETHYPSEVVGAPDLGLPRWQPLRRLWHRVAGNYTDRLIARASGTVLDVGCAYGKFLLPLKQKGCEVYGVEVNPRCVEFCRAAGLSVSSGTIEEAQVADASLDCVILSQVLEHVGSPTRTLKAIHRILKPGGRVFVFCPNGEGYLRDLFGKNWHGWHIPFHLYVFTRQTVARVAEEAGFSVARCRTVTPDDFFTTSLKSWLFGGTVGLRAETQGRVFDSPIFRALACPWLRLADSVLRGKGDCLDIELVKA